MSDDLPLTRWGRMLLAHGILAVIKAAKSWRDDAAPGDLNVLSTIGNAVSREIRRAILLDCLVAHAWNLQATAEALRLGGTAQTIRAIKDLGLQADYDAARREGLIKRGGRRARVKPVPR